ILLTYISIIFIVFFFFFSSRRRHTRSDRDWSSDVCSSDLKLGDVSGRVPPIGPDKVGRFGWRGQQEHLHDFVLGACANELGLERSEERRVGKECRSRWWAYH